MGSMYRIRGHDPFCAQQQQQQQLQIHRDRAGHRRSRTPKVILRKSGTHQPLLRKRRKRSHDGPVISPSRPNGLEIPLPQSTPRQDWDMRLTHANTGPAGVDSFLEVSSPTHASYGFRTESSFASLMAAPVLLAGAEAGSCGSDARRNGNLQPACDESIQADAMADNVTSLYGASAFGPVNATRVSAEVLPQVPFSDNEAEYVRSLPKKKFLRGAVNGYIKFRLKSTELSEQLTESSTRSRSSSGAAILSPTLIRYPDDLGLGCKLDKTDRKLFSFYVKAWCSGRTILPKTNSWLLDLSPMLPIDEGLRPALLALSGLYILDYHPDDQLRKIVNHHYAEAVRLLRLGLASPELRRIGQGDALVGTITILNMLDVVRWEERRPKHAVPRWLEGARVGAECLDHTDPGHRYYNSNNVQVTRARVSNTIVIGRAAILVLATLPLDVQNTSGNKFSWLGHGTERESRMIHGGCGFCAKLLHCFAQITHCAANLEQDPDSLIFLPVAEKLEAVLSSLHQWSELSPGYSSAEQLLSLCQLDAEGSVYDAAAMTDLTAEAWRVAAQIYLQCRVFRLPRAHPKVRTLVSTLSELIRRMPCQGELFTAQAPFMPVFLLGFVSIEHGHRAVANRWFTDVLSATDCRSSVQPAWQVLQRLQTWIDGSLDDDPRVDSQSPFSPLSPIMGNDQNWPRTPNQSTFTSLPDHDLSFDYTEDQDQTFFTPAVSRANHDGLSMAYWQVYDSVPIARRIPWWEQIVQKIYRDEGTVCLI